LKFLGIIAVVHFANFAPRALGLPGFALPFQNITQILLFERETVTPRAFYSHVSFLNALFRSGLFPTNLFLSKISFPVFAPHKCFYLSQLSSLTDHKSIM
jgi:hypothetical protein